MQTQSLPQDSDRIHSLLALAGLLERMERVPGPINADQYRSVVGRLEAELDALDADPRLRQVLAASPACAEIYENRRYQAAGLCLRELDVAVETETRARAAIAAAAQRNS